MGIGAELLSDMMAKEDAASLHFERLLDNKQWETNDSRLLDICDMERNHIINTINFIKKREGFFYGYSDEFVKMFEEELKRRDNPKSLLEGTIVVKLNNTKHKITVKDLLKLID